MADEESLLIERVLALIASKWRISLVCTQTENGPIRFNDLKRKLPGISQHVLTSHLKTLESEDLVTRKSYGEVPPRVEYSITELGRELETIIVSVYDWGQKYVQRDG